LLIGFADFSLVLDDFREFRVRVPVAMTQRHLVQHEPYNQNKLYWHLNLHSVCSPKKFSRPSSNYCYHKYLILIKKKQNDEENLILHQWVETVDCGKSNEACPDDAMKFLFLSSSSLLLFLLHCPYLQSIQLTYIRNCRILGKTLYFSFFIVPE